MNRRSRNGKDRAPTRALTRALACGLVVAAAIGCPRGAGPPASLDTRSFVLLADSALGTRDGSEYRLIRLRDPRGVAHEAWLRLGPRVSAAGDSFATWQPVVILGGIGTGRRAAEVTPCPPGFALLALDYPYTGPRQPTLGEFLGHLGEIHRGALDTPGGVAAAVRWLRTRPDMEPRGAILVGASFGVPFLLRGVAELPRDVPPGRPPLDRGPLGVRAVCLLYGGADLPNLARYRMRESPWWQREAAACGLAWFLGELEPARNVRAVAPRPLFLINGTRDELVSRHSADALWRAAGEPRTRVWLDTPHMQPDAEQLLADLVNRSLDWYRATVDSSP